MMINDEYYEREGTRGRAADDGVRRGTRSRTYCARRMLYYAYIHTCVFHFFKELEDQQ